MLLQLLEALRVDVNVIQRALRNDLNVIIVALKVFLDSTISRNAILGLKDDPTLAGHMLNLLEKVGLMFHAHGHHRVVMLNRS